MTSASGFKDIRVVVAIDIGTTSSGFSYANKIDSEIETNDTWPEQFGVFKTSSALLYDNNWTVLKWGYPALAQEPRKKSRVKNAQQKPVRVDLFKLHMGNLPDKDKPRLPQGLDYKRAFTDYLREFNKLIKEKITSRWPGIRYPQQCLFVMTVPAEWSDETRGIMRDIATHAGLLEHKYSENLEFTTEPEAAAIHCITGLSEYNMNVGSTYMVVDCGGGTVDLTVRRLLADNKLGEITVRTGGLCGGSFVDKEFVVYVGKFLGIEALKILHDEHYGELQYLVSQFCKRAKFPFNGERTTYKPREFDLEMMLPSALRYVQDRELRARLEDCEWLIELDFETVKGFFDKVLASIVDLIRRQLDKLEMKGETCQAIFLVGGFSENRYLQAVVRQSFSNRVRTIAVPKHPIAAVSRGALKYGLNMETVKTRMLKWTYGVETYHVWRPNDDPVRRTPRGYIVRFKLLAQKGTEVAVDQRFTYQATTLSPNQTEMVFHIYQTPHDNAEYCDDPGMRLLGKLQIMLPRAMHAYDHRHVEFSLSFGAMEIVASAINVATQERYVTTFELDI